MKTYQELINQLRLEGKTHSLDEAISTESVRAMNAEMEKVRRDYRRKNAESIQAAKRIILTD